MDTLTPEAIEWSRNHFNMLAEGGTWGVPRSGLLFIKQGGTLLLSQRMPWQDGMPMTAEELDKFQIEDYECIKANFEAAGITVERIDDN
jgi:hypothetical protein